MSAPRVVWSRSNYRVVVADHEDERRQVFHVERHSIDRIGEAMWVDVTGSGRDRILEDAFLALAERREVAFLPWSSVELSASDEDSTSSFFGRDAISFQVTNQTADTLILRRLVVADEGAQDLELEGVDVGHRGLVNGPPITFAVFVERFAYSVPPWTDVELRQGEQIRMRVRNRGKVARVVRGQWVCEKKAR